MTKLESHLVERTHLYKINSSDISLDLMIIHIHKLQI